MPSFEVSFEVFCGTCGTGLCNQSDGRNSRQRNEPQVVVEVCKTCQDRLRDEMQSEIDSLASDNEALREEIQQLQETE